MFCGEDVGELALGDEGGERGGCEEEIAEDGAL